MGLAHLITRRPEGGTERPRGVIDGVVSVELPSSPSFWFSMTSGTPLFTCACREGGRVSGSHAMVCRHSVPQGPAGMGSMKGSMMKAAWQARLRQPACQQDSRGLEGAPG